MLMDGEREFIDINTYNINSNTGSFAVNLGEKYSEVWGVLELNPSTVHQGEIIFEVNGKGQRGWGIKGANVYFYGKFHFYALGSSKVYMDNNFTTYANAPDSGTRFGALNTYVKPIDNTKNYIENFNFYFLDVRGSGIIQGTLKLYGKKALDSDVNAHNNIIDKINGEVI